jgi:hypothetical protein
MRARLRQIKTAMPQAQNGGGGKALRHAHTPPFNSPLRAASPMRLGTESRSDWLGLGLEALGSWFAAYQGMPTRNAYQEYWGSEKTI